MRRRLALIALLAVVVLALALYLTPLKTRWDPAAVAHWLRSTGQVWWAPLAYTGVYILFTLLLVPPLILSAAAALMWGWLAGGMVELVAATLAAFPPYALARWGGGEWLRRKVERRGGSRFYEHVEREGFLAVLLFRLVPVIPFVLLNYLAGFASVPAVRYGVATFLGVIPSVFIFTYSVDAIAAGAVDLRRALPRIFAAGIALAVLALATHFAVRRFR
jgi:uncharacterized membrane protein YdjX (TVP38/TMEM64 family)